MDDRYKRRSTYGADGVLHIAATRNNGHRHRAAGIFVSLRRYGDFLIVVGWANEPPVARLAGELHAAFLAHSWQVCIPRRPLEWHAAVDAERHEQFPVASVSAVVAAVETGLELRRGIVGHRHRAAHRVVRDLALFVVWSPGNLAAAHSLSHGKPPKEHPATFRRRADEFTMAIQCASTGTLVKKNMRIRLFADQFVVQRQGVEALGQGEHRHGACLLGVLSSGHVAAGCLDRHLAQDDAIDDLEHASA